MGCRDKETYRRGRDRIRMFTGNQEILSLMYDTQALKLLIIDEVHLLNEERGAVIETIVARTLRQVCH